MSSFEVMIVPGLAMYGAILGSFAGAQVWRLRFRQLTEDKAAGEPYDKKQLRTLQKLQASSLGKDRSHCLHCGYVLSWYDLIPLLSWVLVRGKCRYCRRAIGWFEPAVEICTALLFVISYLAWPFDLVSSVAIAQFVVWLAICTALVVLFVYDARWYLLPDVYTAAVAVLGIGFFGLGVGLRESVTFETFLSLAGAIGLLSGIYYLLYRYSRGAWVGLGDAKLGVGLGVIVGEWQLAFLVLFLANLIGVLFVLPIMLSGKMNRKSHIPFGPFLIGATIITVLWGREIIEGYLAITTRLFL